MPYRYVDPTDNNKVITFYASGKDKIQVDVYKYDSENFNNGARKVKQQQVMYIKKSDILNALKDFSKTQIDKAIRSLN